MSKQEIFNKSLRGLLAQGAFAIKDDTCQYYIRGRRCAVGLLLTPEEAKARTKEVAAGKENDDVVGEIAGTFGKPWAFLKDLQRFVHDNPAIYGTGYSAEVVLEGARTFAKKYKLSIPRDITKVYGGVTK